MAQSLRSALRSQKGQSLIELSLIAPLMIFLAYGAIEVGQVISTHLTMTHTSREGANLVSRGTIANDALDAIDRGVVGYFQTSNQANWKIIYSKVTQDITVPCPNPPTTPCTYRIESQTHSRAAGQKQQAERHRRGQRDRYDSGNQRCYCGADLPSHRSLLQLLAVHRYLCRQGN